MAMNNLRLLPDVPIGEIADGIQDGLRFDQYATILARTALDTPEPFTIGVYGGWGSGKTSLMRMIMNIVENEADAIGVWFNAWRYEKEEHLIIPLLATILTEMDRHESEFKSGFKAGFTKLRDAFRGILYGVSVKGKISIPGLSEAELSISPKDMIDRYEKLSQMATDRILDQSLYFRSFSKLDEIAQSAKGPKLIIFVDDLDRCFPDKAVALLESIKLVLNQPNISFVLGIAPRIIRAYLTAKYKKDYDVPESLYEDYLDKLVQLPFPIPEIKQNVEYYVRSLLRREEVFGKISKEQFKEQYEPLVSICGPACKDNPRAIIRFLNRLLILTRVHEQKQQDKPAEQRMSISLVHFGITNALQMKWPSVLRACELNREIPVPDKTTANNPLCRLLFRLFNEFTNGSDLISQLERYLKEESNPEKELFRALVTDESLRDLLRSEPGKEWLTKPDLRKEAAATAEQVKTPMKEEQSVRRHEVPWAKDYTNDGWPICRGLPISPGAHLEEANLKAADLIGANLGSAHLEGADLRRAMLEKANLSEAYLTRANLSDAVLLRSNLSNARLLNSILVGANLIEADLEYAQLQAADLTKANLERSWLARADLRVARLEGANLEDAHLGGANLEDANLEGAMYNKRTVWPEGFNPQTAGAIKVNE